LGNISCEPLGEPFHTFGTTLTMIGRRCPGTVSSCFLFRILYFVFFGDSRGASTQNNL